MINSRKLTTIAAALSMGTLLSTGAFASDMTCGDFNAMDTEGQHAAMMEMQGPKGGKDYEQGKARGADNVGEGLSMTTTTSGDTATANDDTLPNDSNAGKDGQQEEARGADDKLASMVEYCAGGDELMVGDYKHPSEGSIAQ